MKLQRVLFPFLREPPPRSVEQLRAIVGARAHVSLVAASGDLAAEILALGRSHAPGLVALVERKGLGPVVRACPYPLLLLGSADGRAAALKRIVVPVLREPSATGALLPAVSALARGADATVVLLGLVASSGAAAVAEHAKAEARLDACHALLRGVPALKRIVAGEATSAITGAVEEEDLLALHADDPWEAVVARARGPVLVSS